MAIQNLGRVGIVLKGAWSGTTSYVPLDLVSYDGNSWVAKRNNTNVEPNTTNTSDWQLISNNSSLISTVQGYKNDAAASASAAAASAEAAAASAEYGSNAVAAIAPNYTDLSFPVSVGQYVWYSGTLYRAKVDIAAAESWTAAHWEVAIIGNELSNQRNLFRALYANATNFPDSANVIIGYTINNSGEKTTNAKRALIERWKYSGTAIKALGIDSGTYDFIVGVYTSTTDSSFVRKLTDSFTHDIQFLPDDANYFTVVVTRKDNANIASSEADAIRSAILRYGYIDTTLSKSGFAADAKTTGDAIANLQTGIDNATESVARHGAVPISFTIEGTGGIHWESGIVFASTVTAHTDYIDVSGYDAIMYRRIGNSSAVGHNGVAFYDSEKVFIPQSGIAPAYLKVTGGYNTELEVAYVPVGAKYARFSVLADTDTYGTFALYGTAKVTDIPMGLHTMPQNTGALNAVRNMRKNTDISFVPAVDIPRTSIMSSAYSDSGNTIYFEDKFAAGVEYKGVAYSEDDDHKDRLVFANRPVDVFITTMVNAQSCMALESAYSSEKPFAAAYYGNSCSTATSYALNLPPIWSGAWTEELIPGLKNIMSIIDNGVRGDLRKIRLADIIRKLGHCAMVTDICRNDDGSIRYIEVSEQSRAGNQNRDIIGGAFGGKARRIMWTPDEFFTQFGDYNIYRYLYLDNVKYIPSLYVPMPDEGERYVYPNLPVLPYYGNMIVFNSSATCKLLIACSGFTHLFVRKNGQMWNENGTTDPYDVDGLAEASIHCDADEAVYTAQLATLSSGQLAENTVPCTWYVKGTPSISASVNDKTLTFTVGMKLPDFVPWAVNYRSDHKVGSGKNLPVFEKYTLTYNDAAAYPYTYTFTVTAGETPTKYVLCLWSDRFGAIYYSGTF